MPVFRSLVFSLIPPLLTAILAPLFRAPHHRPSHIRRVSPISDPSYHVNLSYSRPECHSPSYHRRFFVHSRSCLRVLQTGPTFISLQLRVPASLPKNVTYLLSILPQSAQNISHLQTLNLTDLPPDTDNALTLYHNHQIICRIHQSTFPLNNLILNPSFENASAPPFLPSRFHSHDKTPRQWTPFYNGGAQIYCGPIPLPSDSEHPTFARPHSGNCSLYLGRTPRMNLFSNEPLYYGVHQGVPFHGRAARLTFWYMTSPEMLRIAENMRRSPSDSLALLLSFVISNRYVESHVTIPLSQSEVWKQTCIFIEAPEGHSFDMIHVYFHLHEYLSGVLLIDDVMLTTTMTIPPSSDCSHIVASPPTPFTLRQPRRVDLVAAVPVNWSTLTLAVPLTADRVLRLESLSRQYGGGPILAAVVVADDAERELFTRVYYAKAWLYRHVNVTFVLRQAGPFAINSLRNIAVSSVNTDYVAMIDVDMIPSTAGFACLRDGSFVESLLGSEDERRVLTMPVLISNIHHRTAIDKAEALNLLSRRYASAYCINSQKSARFKRWYSAYEMVDTRLTTDYEPYVIGRKSTYMAFDERFKGYGFNKISWAVAAERCSWNIVLLPNVFFTHLNHVENEWVRDIDLPHYLSTWRAYLAFVAELNDEKVGRTLCNTYATVIS